MCLSVCIRRVSPYVSACRSDSLDVIAGFCLSDIHVYKLLRLFRLFRPSVCQVVCVFLSFDLFFCLSVSPSLSFPLSRSAVVKVGVHLAGHFALFQGESSLVASVFWTIDPLILVLGQLAVIFLFIVC